MISVVIPAYNEEAVLETLYSRLTSAAESWGDSFEVIIVDDCSKDATWGILNEIHKRDPRWKAIRFSRNFGQQIAISAGMKAVSGDCTVILDADLQDPPELISTFLQKWKEGYEVVYAIRTNRKESAVKRACYKTFYWLLSKLAHIDIPGDTGDFCLMDKRVVELINSYRESNRFLRGLRSWTGFRQIGVEYDRSARALGTPSYTVAKLFKLALDGILSFSTFPIRVMTYVGFAVSGLSLLLAAYTLIWRLTHETAALGYATIIITLSFIGGLQLVCIGVIGEYIARIYDEVKRRPLWITDSTLGL
ncbi:MAG: glycosyltransferase family 2 protein [Acidobacteriota bacterium]